MKNLNKLALLVASAAIAMSAGCATSGAATGSVDNWKNGNDATVWRSGDNSLCWQDNYWTSATAANAECGGPAAATTAAVPPVKPPVQADVVGGTQKVSYSADAFFDFDKATIKPAGKQALDELLNRMGGMKSVEVVVATGHTDSTGPANYNEKLSLRRAEAVQAYLV
ncbi:MAG: OmpA family protein, partial [Saezia sp.]